MSRILRSIVAALALSALTAGDVHALPPVPRPESPGLFDALREWAFARLLPSSPSVASSECPGVVRQADRPLSPGPSEPCLQEILRGGGELVRVREAPVFDFAV